MPRPEDTGSRTVEDTAVMAERDSLRVASRPGDEDAKHIARLLFGGEA